MLGLITRARAWRSLPLWALAALLNTSVLVGLLAWYGAGEGRWLSTWLWVLTAWFSVSIYLAFGQVRTRCTSFELSLPIQTRTLWLAHLLAVVGSSLLIAALSFLAIATHQALLGERIRVEPSLPSLAALVAAGLVLASLLLEVPRRSLARIPVTVRYVVWAVLVIAGVPALLAAASFAGAVAGPVLVSLAALAVGGWLYASTPRTFTLVPREPGPADRPAPKQGAGMAPMRAGTLLIPLTALRSASGGAKEALAVAVILPFGAILGGGLDAFGTGSLRELRFLYIPMVTYILFSFIGPKLGSLHYVDTLPIRRGPLVAVLLLPYLVLLCAGYGAGVIAASGARSRLEYVNFEETAEGYAVTVPLRVYEVAWNGNPPVVAAPWGESHVPEPLEPWRRSGPVLYSPFSATSSNSSGFVALQISRATEAVYGASIPPAEIAERYLSAGEGDGGGAVPRGQGLTLRSDYPNLQVKTGPMLPVLVAAAAVPWLLLCAGLLSAYRAGVGSRIRQAIFWGSLGTLLALWLAESALTVMGRVQPWALRGLVEIPVMKLGESGSGTLATCVIAVLLIAGAYRLAHSRFARMEIPTRPTRYTLLERTGESG